MKQVLQDLERAILELVQAPGYQAVKPKVIAKLLKVPSEESHLVRKAVKRMVSAGLLEFGGGHLVYPAGKRKGDDKKAVAEIIGVFRRREAGYGFVRPRGTPPGAGKEDDIYVPPEWSGDASSGDLVRVRLAHRGGAKRRGLGPAGQIVEVIERQTSRFVGTYFEEEGLGYVQVDGTVFAQPIFVGDAGAKSVRPDDKVVIEMLRFPNHYRRGEGVIVEVLGPLGKPGVDTLTVLREFNLPGDFPAEVLADARRRAAEFEETVPPDRYDATGEVTVTIDPEDARDFDDAISLELLPEGVWRLGVHIADVSHFVPPGSPLDHEARDRATSVYLPDRVIPMLPELISNGLASLQPGKLRLTVSAYIEFTAEGIKTDVTLRRSVIRSDKRLTYEQVDAFLADPAGETRRLGKKVADLLLKMRELAALLRARRMRRGALELVMPEVKVDLDRGGQVMGAHVVPNTESHQMIEEFMLAANEAVAETLYARGWPFLRRIHRPPSLRKLRLLQEFLEGLGYPTDQLEDRFSLQRILRHFTGEPKQYAVHYAVLRTLQRAGYSPQEEGHFALASDCYCHFTSPIRRYPDLTVHRLVHALLLNENPRINPVELVELGEHCSAREERAELAERELVRLKLLAYLGERIGLEMEAVVTGVESYGMFVQGVALPAEGLVHIESMTDDFYRFDRATHSLTGHRAGRQYRLGDLVKVAVARVDMERRQLDLRLIEHLGHPGPNTLGDSLRTFDWKKRKSGKMREPLSAAPRVVKRKVSSESDKRGGPAKKSPGKSNQPKKSNRPKKKQTEKNQPAE